MAYEIERNLSQRRDVKPDIIMPPFDRDWKILQSRSRAHVKQARNPYVGLIDRIQRCGHAQKTAHVLGRSCSGEELPQSRSREQNVVPAIKDDLGNCNRAPIKHEKGPCKNSNAVSMS